MKRLLWPLAVLLLCANVQAAGLQAVLSWVAPTTNTDGTPITGTLTYNVYQGAQGAEGVIPVQTGISATTLTVTSGLAPNSKVCWLVTAVEGGQESAKSNEACKTFPPSTPVAPTTLTVQ